MKKLYFLNEEESKRILNLHKEATKKQYLSEQELDEADMGNVASNAASGAIIGAAWGGGVFSVPGAIIGGAVGAIYGLLSNSNSSDGAKKILQACTNTKLVGPASQTRQQLNAIADGLNTAIEGMGTDEDAIKSNLQKITTIPDLCGMAKIYQTRHGENLFDAIDGDIDSEGEWKQYVFLPLLDAYENSVDLGKKLAAQKESSVVKGFEKFPCIPSNPKAKSSKLSDGSIAYIIDGVVYYGNGRKKLVDGTMANYSCGKESSNTKTNTKTKVKQPTIPSDTDLDMVLTKL